MIAHRRTPPTAAPPPGLSLGHTPQGASFYYVPASELSTEDFKALSFDLFSAAGWYPDDDALFFDDRYRLDDGEIRYAAGVLKVRKGAPGYYEVLTPRGYPGWAAEVS